MSRQDALAADIDLMRDVYMSRAQREAYDRIVAAALLSGGGDGWQPIETCPRGEAILYHPPETGRNAKCAMVKVDRYPTSYPRKPTHWMPLPAPPTTPEASK